MSIRERVEKCVDSRLLSMRNRKGTAAKVAIYTVIIGIAAFILGVWSTAIWADSVRLSEGGICHCEGGQYYDSTAAVMEYDTLDACLEAGGREPKRGQGQCPTPPQTVMVTVPDLVKCSVLMGKFLNEKHAVPATRIVGYAIRAGCWMGSDSLEL